MRITKGKIAIIHFVRKACLAAVLLIPVSAFSAENVKLAISDFKVQSENKQYRFLGKGFAELIGVDISKSKNIDLIEREKRVEIMKEQTLSLSGLIDEKDQVKVGKMLAAKFIVAGSIFDIADQLTVTFKVIDTATGKVLYQDKISGKISNYDYISAQISQKIMNSFALSIPKSIADKAEKPVEKSGDAAVSFSNAVEAYDNKDMQLAKKELEKAKGLDPESEAVAVFLKKLLVNTSKFKTLTEEGYPNQNPAYLGMMKYDKLFFSTSFINMQEAGTVLKSQSDMKVVEQDLRVNAGYQFPLGDTVGVSFEGMFFHYKDQLDTISYKSGVLSSSGSYGGMASLGWSVNEYLSLGGSVSVFNQRRAQMVEKPPVAAEDKIQNSMKAGTSFGFVVKNADGTLFFDSMAGYSTRKIILIDPNTYNVSKEVKSYIYNESTLTVGMYEKTLFFALKEVNNIYTDREYFVCRLIPAMEYWVKNWISFRGGLEYSYVKMNGDVKNGLGFTGGLSLRRISSGLDLDVNITKRKRPARVEAGQLIDETIVSLGMSMSNIYLSR